MSSSPQEPLPPSLVPAQTSLAALNGFPAALARDGLWQQIADSLPAMIWMCATGGRATFFNSRWLRFTGYALAQARGDGWIAALHPEDAGRRLAVQQAAIEARRPFEAEYRLRGADGEYHWMLDHAAPRFGARGVFAGHVGVAVDITSRKRAEDKLRWLSKAVEQSPASVVITSLEGEIQYVNPKFTEITGYSFEEALGKNPRMLKSGEMPPEAYRKLWETIRTGEWRGELHNRKKNGELYWEAASICPIRDEAGQPAYYIAVKEDITARKEMEAALRASAERLRVAARTSRLCVYDLDLSSGRIEMEGPDPFLCSLRTLEAWERAIHPDDHAAVMEAVRRRWNTAGPFAREYRLVHPDGAVRTYMHYAAAVRDGRWAGAIQDITARKQSDESQARLAAIVEGSSDAILSIDAEGAVRSWNRAAEKLYGYSAGEILTRPAATLSAPDRRGDAARNIAAVAGGASLAAFETEHVRKDGVVFPVSIAASPIRDLAGKLVGGSVIIRDITAQKRARQELLESQNRFRALVQNSSDIITLMDPAGVILYDSPGACEMLGIAPGQRLGTEVFGWLHPDELSYARKLQEELLATPGARLRAQFRVRHTSGSWRWCDNWLANLLEEPGVRALVSTSRDITELKGVESALRDSEQRYRKLIEDASDIIFTIDLEGNLTSVNAAAERISGFSRPELLGMNLARITAPEYMHAVRARIAARAAGAAALPMESELVARDGRRVAMEVTSRLQVRNGTPEGLLCIARDVSQRKRAERLEHQRREVLEMVAQNQPLDDVLRRIEEMIEEYYPGAAARVSVQADLTGSAPAASLRRLEGLYQGRIEVPIRAGDGRLLGNLEVHRPEPWQPDEAEMVLLDSKAKLASVALEHRQLTNRMAHQAQHDPLTGLPNRTLLDDRLSQAIILARRQARMVAVLYVDLDRFKVINDTLGHHTGDLLLREASRRMLGAVRQSDTLARTGGDEFVAVLFGLDSQLDAEAAGERIIEAMREPFLVQGHELFTSASVGLSLFPRDGEDAATLLKHADVALYEAKNQGRNRFAVFASTMNSASHERLQIENHLHRALDRGELVLHYQPQFEIATGQPCGVEALLRWNHPKLGLLPPNHFVPVAEETGLIIPISLWVLREACRQHQLWRRAGYPPLRMAVNISATQFMRSNLAAKAAEVLAAHEMEPRFLELELTEGVLMRDAADSARQLAALRALGVRISIDDFGTGYSSLSYLQRLPIDDLKIDKCFVQGIGRDTGARPLVQAIVGLAHGLNLTATAEGVETEEEFAVLRALGCDRVQGFLLGRPAPADELSRVWLPAAPDPASVA